MAAETATASAPAPAGGRPQKPDENAFKSDLEKAEKAHKAAMDRLVCTIMNTRLVELIGRLNA